MKQTKSWLGIIIAASIFLIFAHSESFAGDADQNDHQSAILTTAQLSDLTSNKCPIRTDSPGYSRIHPSVTYNSSSDDVHNQLLLTICNIRSLRSRLESDIGNIRDQQTWFDSSIIAAGIGAVASAFYKSPATAVGGIALAANGITSYRSYYNPELLGSKYITAVKAARCVSSNAEKLLNQSPAALWTQMANLKQGIANVNATAANLTGATQAENDGQDAAAKAVAAAESAYAGVLAEAQAYNDAPSVVDQAHDAINNFVDIAKHRTGSSFSDIQSQLNNGLSTQANSTAQTESARAQLMSVFTATAKAQASAAQVAAAPDAKSEVGTPTLAPPNAIKVNSLADAQTPPEPQVPTTASTTSVNTPRISAAVVLSQNVQLNSIALVELNSLTTETLKLTPAPEISSINNAIMACTATLAS